MQIEHNFFFILLFILFFILSLLMIFQSEACPKYKLQKITEAKWNLNFQFINYSGWVFSLNPECITRLTALFVTRHPISLEFRDWLKDTLIPDESFYATLSRVRGLDPETELVVMDTKTKTLHDYCVRISLWRLQNITCAGMKKNSHCSKGKYYLALLKCELQIWHFVIAFESRLSEHSSEIRGLCLMKYSKNIANFEAFW